MSAVTSGEEAVETTSNDVPSDGESGEKKENGLTEPETGQHNNSSEPKMEEVAAESGEDKPVEAANKAAGEAAADAAASAATKETTAATEDSETQNRTEDHGNNENTMKDTKVEPEEDSRSSGMDCEKSITVCEDGEKPSNGGGELGDKRRPSEEMSSSDGEPLSRMDSEDR